MIKTFFYTFLQTKQQEENANSTDFYHPLPPQEIEIRPITPFPWEIIKTLSIDELCTGGKFKLPLEQIQNAMLSYKLQDVMPLTDVIGSFQIKVKDLDTNTFHSVILWKYPHEDTFVMRGSWFEEFVYRRKLVAGMVVGMYWDFNTGMFCFSVLKGSE